MNKYTAGLAAEIKLSPNISLEGVFRYAEYNVRPDLVMMNFAAAQVANGMGEANPLDRLGISVIGAMRQTMMGGNIKYELFPDALITPYVGGGVVHFNNDYHTDSKVNYVKITLPQSVYAANALAGMKLKLSRKFSILCRAEAGSLLNNRNGSIYWGPYGNGGQVYSYHNFRSYDKYWSGLVGMSFGM